MFGPGPRRSLLSAIFPIQFCPRFLKFIRSRSDDPPVLGSLDLNSLDIEFEYDFAQVHALHDESLKLYFELYFDLFDVFVSWPPTTFDRFQGLI